VKKHSTSFAFKYNFKKTYGFPNCFIVFYSTAVSSISVYLYGYRLSADAFSSKSVCHLGVLIKNLPIL
jgi:hypothetical protein